MRRRKVEGKEGPGSSVKMDIAMTISVAKEAIIFSVSDNSVCSNGRGGEDECSSSEETGIGDGDASKKGPLCYGSG